MDVFRMTDDVSLPGTIIEAMPVEDASGPDRV
jgi:hypothetical protein